jgi:site-specific DNA recombinase
MSKRAALYARVSYDDRDNDGRNLAGQLEMAREYAASKGYRVVAEFAEDDRGASGASFELEQLNRVREMAQAGQFDVLIPREIDRLSRNLAKQLIVEEELRRAGVGIEYVLAEYPDSPEGRLNKHIRATIAEYEREKIKERNVRGRRNVVRQGRIMLHGDRPPYGYRLSADGMTLVIHEPEANIVRKIFAWYAEGDETGQRMSSYKMAKVLSEMKIPSWSDVHGIICKDRGYGQWTSGIVLDIIHSETYKGQWHYGRRNGSGNKLNPRDQWITLEVPAIVSTELWEKAQGQIQKNKTQADRNLKRDYLLRHRARCQCGYSVQGYCVTCKRKSGVKMPYLYYRCNGRVLETARKDCRLPSFRVDHVDAAVWEWIKSLLSDSMELARGLNDFRVEQDEGNMLLRHRLEVVEDLIAENRLQYERLLDLYLSGDIAKELLCDRKVRLESTIAALEAERVGLLARLESHTLSDEQIQSLQDFAAEVAEGLAAAEEDFETRRQVIEALDVRVTLAVEDDQKVIYVRCVLGEIDMPISDCTTHFSK